MKYEPHWSHPLILAVAICAVHFAIEGPKLLRTKAASAEPEGDHYKDLRAGIKALGDTAFDSMKQTAEAAIKIADALNREVTAQDAARGGGGGEAQGAGRGDESLTNNRKVDYANADN